MSIRLLIKDGIPDWYLSPDIWVVPGPDPMGNPGPPVAGLPGYVWARVSNMGKSDAERVRVDFYWANPSLQVTRTNANRIGSAFVDVPADGTQDVLCLSPWTPVMVNDGHECLVAVAGHAADPLPDPLPDAFDPPNYRQVAQKNLSVLAAGQVASYTTLTISGWRRAGKSVVVTSEIGGVLDGQTLRGLGLEGWRAAEIPAVEVELLATDPCAGRGNFSRTGPLSLEVPRGASAAVHAGIRLSKGIGRKEYQMVRILEHENGKILGGLGFVVISKESYGKEERP